MHLSICRPAMALAALLALAGCGRDSAPSTPAASPTAAEKSAAATAVAHLPPGIDWHTGDVAAAFAAAKAANKPLFLYWGAEWCPPCAQIKATIFARREFQERSRLFVPLYLDGDTPSAQEQGERFGVIGYPTMILFRPDGTEITRLPGGVDIARYATILDIALADARPVGEILAAARAGQALTDNDWRLPAYYEFDGDQGRALPAGQAIGTLATLVERCPASLPEECSRLEFQYLGALAAAARDAPLGAAQRATQRAKLTALLGSPAAVTANVANLVYRAPAVIELLSEAGSPERATLTAAWRGALDRLDAAGDALSPPERLNVLRARVLLARLEEPDAPLPGALLDQVRARVAEVDAAVKDGYARHAAINASANLLWEAGLDAEANRLLSAELERSSSPYYFMLNLADLAQRAGRKDEAVTWLARAWQGSRGPATRFQWGYNYLVGLLEMQPEDASTIETAGLAVLGELEGVPDAFHQRTSIRLGQLSGKLLEWGQASADRAAVIESLRGRVSGICKGMASDDPGRSNCEAFLAAPGVSA